MGLSCTAAKLLWPSNFAIPASNKISPVVCVNAVHHATSAQAIWGNQPDQGSPREQMWLMRIMPSSFAIANTLSFTVATNTGAVSHFFGSKAVKQGVNVFSAYFDYAANTTARLRYIASDGTTMEEDATEIPYTTTTEVNPIVALASGDGTIPFLGTAYWMYLFDADYTDANWELSAGLTNPGIYRSPLRYLAANRINGVDFHDAKSCLRDNKTREVLTLSGTYTEASDATGVEMAVSVATAGLVLRDSVDGSSFPTGAYDNGTDPAGTSVVTTEANKPIVVIVCTGHATAPGDPVVSGGGLTWNLIGSIATWNAGKEKIAVYAAYPTSAASFNLTVTTSGVTNTYCVAHSFVITNSINSASFSAQTPVAGSGTGTTATSTLAALQPGSGTIIFAACLAAGTSLTEVAPLTAVEETQTTTPIRYTGVYFDPAGDTTQQVTVGVSAAWGVIAVEVALAPAASGGAGRMRGRGRGRGLSLAA